MALTPNRVRTMLTEVGCPSMPYPWIKRSRGELCWSCANPVSMYELLRRLSWASGATQHSADAVWQSIQDAPDHYGVDTSRSAAFTETQLDHFCRLVARDLK